MRWTPLVLVLACSCGVRSERYVDTDVVSPDGPVVLPETAQVEIPDDFEASPLAGERLHTSDEAEALVEAIESYFVGRGTRRVAMQLDRPMYRPGDSIWVASYSLISRGMSEESLSSVTLELMDPQGSVVQTKVVQQRKGVAHNDFVLDPGAAGGKWTVRATAVTGETDERDIIVSAYQTPRIQKSLDFVREAYGPGDVVEALVELSLPTGAALADHTVTALLQLDGVTVFEDTLTTDASGAVFVRVPVPQDATSSDGLLTVLVEDAGLTESISRSVPMVMDTVDIRLFPEGGDLVSDLPGRVYVQATNAFGEPADITADVVDDQGHVVAEFSTLHDGMGRFAFTPEFGRSYDVVVTSSAGFGTAAPLPEALAEGCSLRSFDDVRSEQDAVRVAVRCTQHADVTVVGVQQESVIDSATVRTGPREDAVVYLTPPDEMRHAQGAVRVTVFNAEDMPLAERLVYRNAGHDLDVELSLDKEQYGPRDEVVVTVQTTGPDGQPLPASLSLAVVDDAVLSLADDEEGTLQSRLYLSPDLMEIPKDPGFYYDDDELLAARGLDLVMGTKGWRRFDWDAVWNPPLLQVETITRTAAIPDLMAIGDVGADALPVDMGLVGNLDAAAVPPIAQLATGGIPGVPMAVQGQAFAANRPMANRGPRQRWRGAGIGRDQAEMPQEEFNFAFDGLEDVRGEYRRFAVVRQFPAPDYSAGFDGVRTDFRDTVHWEPTVQTDESGHAEVRFYLSDATTTFRLTAQGVGEGYVGHGEAVMSSVLPVSLDVQLPSVVSAGDTLLVPLTASNSRPNALQATASVVSDSSLFDLQWEEMGIDVPANGAQTTWLPVTVGAGQATAELSVSLHGGGLSDSAVHSVTVVEPGFPRSWSGAGESEARTELSVFVDEFVPETLHASIAWQPSPVSNLMHGMDALIRTPGGCFEQTSSTNWPNVAIIKYLEAHDSDPRLRAQSSQALAAGYERLAGYQVAAGGFETFGSGPGKEALSAFGLLQFADMATIYPVDDALLDEDVAYLLAQRDGQGGFKNSGESAHGYGSAPPAVLNGFITWSLVSTGHADALPTEIEHQATVARTSTDPYVLALATRTLLAAQHPAGEHAVERLAALQAEDGSFPGAQSSITRSYEANLLVESTALSALALMDADGSRSAYDAAAAWLVENRRGTGSWGATQATAMALDALTVHAEKSRRPRVGGRLAVEVNGRRVSTVSYTADQTEAIEIDGWQDALSHGQNTVTLIQLEGEPLPYTANVAWTSITPDNHPGAELGLTTVLASDQVSLGSTVRMTTTVDNQTDDVVPSPIARIGIPAGLEAQVWQLEQLQERGQIAFFETRPREVTLYWEGIHVDEAHEVVLDLLARNAGDFTAPASSAYPYYDDDEMAWEPGVHVTIARD